MSLCHGIQNRLKNRRVSFVVSCCFRMKVVTVQTSFVLGVLKLLHGAGTLLRSKGKKFEEPERHLHVSEKGRSPAFR